MNIATFFSWQMRILTILLLQKELEISMEEGEGLLEGEVPLKVSCSARGTQDLEKRVTLSVIEDVELALSV